jgi:hypothetical protein
VRLQPAAADAGDLALVPDQLRQPPADQHRLDHQVRREQLARRQADRGGSFDASSNSLSGMLQFFAPHVDPVILNPTTGAVARN